MVHLMTSHIESSGTPQLSCCLLPSGGTGLHTAAAAATRTVTIMIRIPPERLLIRGAYVKTAEISIPAMTVIRTGLDSLAGGMMIAMNIPYSAIPSALISLCGRISPAAAPVTVPETHPKTEMIVAPYE